MSLLREIKPRNARTARIVKAREPQIIEERKKILLLHGAKCPLPLQTVLKTFSTLTKPHSITFNKKNENIHPFEDASSLEFLASKNECGVVVFGSHSKKRPNTITVLRTFDNKSLDMIELLLLTQPSDSEQRQPKMPIGVEMKPLILFAGSQWDDESSTAQTALFRTLKSTLLDIFSGEEITSVDVGGLQYVLMIAADEPSTPTTRTSEHEAPTIHLRWYTLRTIRSNTPKLPRVELDPAGPALDFRVGRFKEADENTMKEALKSARGPNEARTKKNIETDLVGDKLGRVHLGKQDLKELQTRKMKGLKRGRDEDDKFVGTEVNGDADEDMGDGGVEIDEISVSGSGSEEDGLEGVEFVDEDAEDDEEDVENEIPKRQRLV